MHAPEGECIAKRKAHKPYEFGVKTSLATPTPWCGFGPGAVSLPGGPYEGHTLEEQLEQIERLTGMMPRRHLVDRGHKGRGVEQEGCRGTLVGSGCV